MARKRMIDPEFWSDEEIGQWSHSARLFYIALWNFADDRGKFKAANALLKAQIFPYDTKVDIDKLKSELNHKVQWYEVDGLKYGLLRNFLKHQRIDKPSESRLPEPPEGSPSTPRIVGEESRLREEKLSKEKLREDNIYVDFEKSTLTAWNYFQSTHPTLSKVQEISAKRRSHLKRRFEQKSFNMAEILAAVAEQPFCMGENDRQWKISFDWLIENDTNYLKVLERKYKNGNIPQGLKKWMKPEK